MLGFVYKDFTSGSLWCVPKGQSSQIIAVWRQSQLISLVRIIISPQFFLCQDRISTVKIPQFLKADDVVVAGPQSWTGKLGSHSQMNLVDNSVIMRSLSLSAVCYPLESKKDVVNILWWANRTRCLYYMCDHCCCFLITIGTSNDYSSTIKSRWQGQGFTVTVAGVWWLQLVAQPLPSSMGYFNVRSI